MSKDLVAKATTSVDAQRDAVWKALVSPDAIGEYMFGTTVVTAWQRGSPISWKGEWKGKPSEANGLTAVTLTQNRNATEEERQHSEANWKQMLEGLKKYVEAHR